jgi:hypothetical protein
MPGDSADQTVGTGDPVDDRTVLASRAEAALLRARLANFEAEAIAGTIDAASFVQTFAALLDRMAAGEKSATAARLPIALGHTLSPGQDIAPRCAAMKVAAQRDVLRELCAAVTIAPAASPGYRRQPRRGACQVT